MVSRLILFSLIALIGPASARAAIERVVERSFSVSTGVTLLLKTFHGSVKVNTADTDRARITVYQTIDAATEAEADQRLASMGLTFSATADLVSVDARPEKSWRWAWEKWPPVGLRFEITLPRACRLDLTTQEGDIFVGAVEGAVRARTESGTVFVGEVDGTISVSSGRGDVAVTACTGELTIVAKLGDVLVGRSGDAANVQGSGGTIEVQQASGSVNASGEASDIKVGFVHPFRGASVLRAAGGDISLSVDRRSACTFDLRASAFGEVRVRELPIEVLQGKIGASRLSAALNGGGATISATASGGSIRLTGRDGSP